MSSPNADLIAVSLACPKDLKMHSTSNCELIGDHENRDRANLWIIYLN